MAVPPGGVRKANNHLGFAVGYNSSGGVSNAIGPNTTCLTCHNEGSGSGQPGEASDFSIALIGTDLRNDHPVGVTFPVVNGPGTDWRAPTGSVVRGSMTSRFFDENPSNGRMDKSEIRLYDSGNGASVECASCHDPHGVPSNGGPTFFNATFMRKTNDGSALCMTCHTK